MQLSFTALAEHAQGPEFNPQHRGGEGVGKERKKKSLTL
jgi:hypothetical protein